MVKSKLVTTLMMIGLIGLMMSCSHVEQVDHEKPVKPMPKESVSQIAYRLKHTNKPWYKAKQIGKG